MTDESDVEGLLRRRFLERAVWTGSSPTPEVGAPFFRCTCRMSISTNESSNST